jgi:putative transcriptional regulator
MELFKYSDGNVEPQKGDLLISEPFLADPNFTRTVILLCEHNEEGSFGFVLNKPSNVRLNEVIEDVDNSDFEVYLGGPVQHDTFHFIHQCSDLLEGGHEVINGVHWGGNFEQLMIMVQNKQLTQQEVKFFVGYSGWSSGQLLDELKLNSWIISRNVDVQQIFNTDSEKLWQEVLDGMGGKFKVISKFPVDPRLN